MLIGICLLVGLGLAICGVAIAVATRNNRSTNTQVVPPPLPPRTYIGTDLSVMNRQATVKQATAGDPRALPPRRTSVSATAGAMSEIHPNELGPRGILPEQFPACPFDKQRNEPGVPQKIFWDEAGKCYRCSHGHRFKSNGRIICS